MIVCAAKEYEKVIYLEYYNIFILEKLNLTYTIDKELNVIFYRKNYCKKYKS